MRANVFETLYSFLPRKRRSSGDIYRSVTWIISVERTPFFGHEINSVCVEIRYCMGNSNATWARRLVSVILAAYSHSISHGRAESTIEITVVLGNTYWLNLNSLNMNVDRLSLLLAFYHIVESSYSVTTAQQQRGFELEAEQDKDD